MSPAPEHGDYLPTATWERLCQRGQLLRRLRLFFDERGFIEVHTPILSADTVIDRHLDPVPVTLAVDPRQPEVGPRYWLQTSPEFGMKRLLAAGAQAIYQVTKAFRLAERGPLHNPEFTMVEWYRVGDDYQAGMQLLADLAEVMFDRGPALKMSFAEAFQNTLGIDPHRAEVAELKAIATHLGVDVAFDSDDRDAWLDLLLVEAIQPKLGTAQPVILYDFPASQSALAQVRPGPPAVAERFELYVDGLELANGYHELLDPAELRRRNHVANQQRIADGKPPLPVESRLLAAMDAGLPSCSGTALGFDRLVMAATGAKTIDEVIPFPIERA